MSKPTPSLDFLAFIPQAIESHWDNVWAPRLAGFPVNIVYAASIDGVGLAQATYNFDPGTFVESEQSRQMRYRPVIDSDFSVLVKLHQDGGIDTFKYRGSEMICEASGADFRSAMIPRPHAAWPSMNQSTIRSRPGDYAIKDTGMCHMALIDIPGWDGLQRKGGDLRPLAHRLEFFLSKPIISW